MQKKQLVGVTPKNFFYTFKTSVKNQFSNEGILSNFRVINSVKKK